MKDRIIIWGGNRRPLTLEHLDSHAAVSAYFLTQELRAFYDVINLVDMDAPQEILKHENITAVITTFQKGFTNRVLHKGKRDLLCRIQQHVQGPLCALYDVAGKEEYAEDIIFAIRKPRSLVVRKLNSYTERKRTHIVCLGWHADAQLCAPLPIADTVLRVFVDHPPYNEKAWHALPQYYAAFKALKEELLPKSLEVYHQHNDGIVAWQFDGTDVMNVSYKRTAKVPWKNIIKEYGTAHVFCITHLESACLSAIEAAMSGAKLYVPRYSFLKWCIAKELLDQMIQYRIINATVASIKKALREDARNGFDRSAQHEQLAQTHSWQSAAALIHTTLKAWNTR